MSDPPVAAPPSRSDRRLWRCGLATLLAAHAVLLLRDAAVNGPTWDEPAHLAAGLAHWETGRADLYAVNPPLVRAVAALPVWLTAAPALNPEALTPDGFAPEPRRRREVGLGRQLAREHGRTFSDWLRTARFACLPFPLAGLLVCGLWARELYGTAGGLTAAALWCFSPLVLGHGALITPDVAAAALGAWYVFLLRGWLRTPGWAAVVAPALLGGLALASKATWLVLLPPLTVVLWLMWRAGRGFWSGAAGRRALLREVAQLIAIGCVALGVLHATYGFRHPLPRLGEPEFVSRTFAGDAPGRGPSQTGNRFRGSWADRIPVPIPRTLLEGIDVQRYDFERGFWSPALAGYLLGEFHNGGWWYFYFAAMAFKTPLGAALAAAAAVWARLGGGLRPPPGEPRSGAGAAAGWREGAVPLVAAVAVLALVSSQRGLNVHLRYALPAYPFLFVWTAGAAAAVAPAARTVSAAGILWLAAASLWASPHHLGFFNPLADLAGGKGAVLLDSNLDWGQDLPFLEEWLAERPEIDGLRLAYFGGVEPAYRGLNYTLPPPLPPDHADRPAAARPFLGPAPGWYAISESFVRGRQTWAPDGRGRFRTIPAGSLTYFSRVEPFARPAPSIAVYHLSPETTDRLRASIGLPPWGAPPPSDRNRPLAPPR